MTRDSRFDNAKFFAIYLVVAGHLIEPIISAHPSFRYFYMSIYAVHMPLFSFIAGYFSFPKIDRSTITKLIKGILIPFVVFTAFYEAFAYARNGYFSGYTINLVPYWILWFLISLAIWRLLLPLFRKLPYYIFISIALSLIAGCFDNIGMRLGLSRTIYFFPFFLMGYHIANHPAAIHRYTRINKTYPIAALATIATIVFIFKDLPVQWLYGSTPYGYMQTSDGKGIAIRSALYALSFSATLSLLILTSKRSSYFSVRGRSSLTVYLWHGFVVLTFAEVGYHYYTRNLPPGLRLLSIALLAFALTIILSTPALQTLTNRLLLTPTSRRTLATAKR